MLTWNLNSSPRKTTVLVGLLCGKVEIRLHHLKGLGLRLWGFEFGVESRFRVQGFWGLGFGM